MAYRRAYWKNDRLMRYRDLKLREIVRYAFDHVPFYRRKFRDLGINPTDIMKKDDLEKLPTICKDEIRAEPRDLILSNEYVTKNLRRLSTSGSTGKPLFLYVNDFESELRKAKHLRANIGCGQRPWHRWVNITAPHHFAEMSKFQKAVGLFTPTPVSVFADVSTQVSIIRRLRPDVLDGYSSSLLLLVKKLERDCVKDISPQFVLGGSELIDRYSREYIESVLDARFYDQYSTVEFDRIACECPKRLGYHIEVDNLILEFLDENNEEVSKGERGRIVCTSLFNFAMPFIRYEVGDIGIPSGELCTCGRTFPLMKMIEGRRDSILVTPDGKQLTPRTFTIAMSMFEHYSLIDQFQVVQEKLDRFVFCIKLKGYISSIKEDLFKAELVSHLENVFGFSSKEITFEVRFVDTIQLNVGGKLMAVVSKVRSTPN